jgi:hypothetical protein
LQFKYLHSAKVLLFLIISILAYDANVKAQPSKKSKNNSPRRISFTEAQNLLVGEKEGNLSKDPRKLSITRLSSGQVLKVYYPLIIQSRTKKSKNVPVPGYGLLYESEAAFKDENRTRHMLEELIPDGRDLIANIQVLVTRLEKRLRVRAGKLDYSRASLRQLDSYIKNVQRSSTTAQTNPNLFQELTAYYGETLRRALDGEWYVNEEPVGETHIQPEPNIRFKKGGMEKEIKPWISVISALYDEDRRGIGLTKVYDNDLAATGY